MQKYGISLKENIYIKSLIIKKNIIRIKFYFKKDSRLQYYFNRDEFVSIYTNNMEKIPLSIAVIPFICNILPIIWLTDCNIIVEKLDKNFFNCIEKIKEGFKKMYPECNFRGNVLANELVNDYQDNKSQFKYKKILFFSGGIDATLSLIDSYKYNPLLFGVLGADIGLNNVDKWKYYKNFVKNYQEKYSLHSVYCKSNFRRIVHEPHLNTIVPHTSWYSSFQCAIGLSSLAIPLCFFYGINEILISGAANFVGHQSSTSVDIEGNLKAYNISVYRMHNNLGRQDKVKQIVKFKNNNNFIQLRTCLRGELHECCSCEKCSRAILAIIAEKANPSEYGFDDYKNHLEKIKYIVSKTLKGKDTLLDYFEIQNRMIKNFSDIEYKDEFSWFLKIDFIEMLVKQIIKNKNQ